MNDSIKTVSYLAAIAFFLLAVPFLLIWAVNTLADGFFYIQHELENYAAVLVVIMLLRGKI